MPVVFDNTFLALLFGPLKTPPADPRTGKPVDRAEARIEALVERLARGQVRILIPTPALCEFLSIAGRPGAEYLAQIDSTSRFQIVPFDTAAAVEAAFVISAAVRGGDKRGGRKKTTPWQKVKFDRQIVAIATVRGATEIYSDDEDIAAFGKDAGIDVYSVAELPLPPPKQEDLPLESP
jgi:predicted nucleic acid-binding protein